MRITAALFFTLFSYSAAWSQQATVEVTLKPAGSFKGTTQDVKGFAVQKGTKVEAQNITVNLTKLQTGITLRDEHTRKYLEVDKHPEAVLVSASGQSGKGEGIIRIKGIEKKISGSYAIEGSQLKATFPVKFSDFKITGIKYMGVGVQDDGLIHITVPLKK